MSEVPFLHAGEAFALAAAVVWSGAVILYKKAGDTVHPIALNLFKNAFSLLFFIPTVLLAGGFEWQAMQGRDALALAASGVLGISLSDTCLFKALQRLGAGMYAIVDCLYVVFTVGLAYIVLGERMATWQVVGAVVVTAAVSFALYQPSGTHHERRETMIGLAWGVVSMLAIAISVVLMKDALSRVSALDAIVVRVGAGIAALLPFALGRSGARILRTLRGTHWPQTLAGSFLGMYGATLLWVLGMKYTLASVASCLNQLSNVFVFVLAAFFLHERLSKDRLAAILLATGGALLVILGG